MTQEHLKELLTPEAITAIKALAWAFGALSTAIVGACGVLIRKAFQLGAYHSKNEETTKKIDEALGKLERLAEKLSTLPLIESTVGILRDATARNTSDIRALVSANAHAKGIEEGVRRAKSNPDFNGSGGTQ